MVSGAHLSISVSFFYRQHSFHVECCIIDQKRLIEGFDQGIISECSFTGDAPGNAIFLYSMLVSI